MSDARLYADELTLAYGEHVVARQLSLSVPEHRITCIVGPNACGKSTLLRALARLVRPRAGTVRLDGESLHDLSTRLVATRLGVLPQGPVAPEGLTVAGLVERGRYPHRRWLTSSTARDREAVSRAMVATGVERLVDRPVDELSGGQRQRVWLAMVLAQETPILLLDEPTTYLDLAHQTEVLDLLVDLNQADGRTIVMVLHDLNQAARYAHHVVAVRDGRVVAQGEPAAVITESLVAEVFGLRCRVIDDPVTGAPLMVPLGRHGRGVAP